MFLLKEDLTDLMVITNTIVSYEEFGIIVFGREMYALTFH